MKLIIDIPKIVYDRIIKGYEISEDIDLKWMIKNGTPFELGNLSVEAIEELSHCPACIHYIQRDIPSVFCDKCVNRDELYRRIENDI